jgi:hypothetical protein
MAPCSRGTRLPMVTGGWQDGWAQIRASDADREWAAAFLKHHFAEGRLSEEELSERAEAAYRARTLAELYALVHDLPGAPAPRARALSERPRSARRLALYGSTTVAVGVICALALLAVWMMVALVLAIVAAVMALLFAAAVCVAAGAAAVAVGRCLSRRSGGRSLWLGLACAPRYPGRLGVRPRAGRV